MKIVSLNNIPVTTTVHNKAGKKQQLIQEGEITHLHQFAQVSFVPGEVATAHKHKDLYEVFFVESGNGTIQIDGKDHLIEKGTCITVEPNEMHEVINTGNEELILTYFSIEK